MQVLLQPENRLGVAAIAITALLLLVLAAALYSGRARGLMAGYNTMGRQEKGRWNERALARAVGLYLAGFTLVFAAALLSSLAGSTVLFTILLVLAILSLAPFLVYVNTAGRFKNR